MSIAVHVTTDPRESSIIGIELLFIERFLEAIDIVPGPVSIDEVRDYGVVVKESGMFAGQPLPSRLEMSR